MSTLLTQQMESVAESCCSITTTFRNLIVCCKRCAPSEIYDDKFIALLRTLISSDGMNDWVIHRSDGYKLFVPYKRCDVRSDFEIVDTIRSGDLLFVHLSNVTVRSDSNLVRAYREFAFGGAFNDY